MLKHSPNPIGRALLALIPALCLGCSDDTATTGDSGVDVALTDQGAPDTALIDTAPVDTALAPTKDAGAPVDAAPPADTGPPCSAAAPCAAKTCHQADCVAGHCQWSPQHGTLCDDGSPCTVGDRCEAGACTAGDNNCECAVDKDCILHDDGNFCNGTLICDTKQVPNRCVLKVGSPVVCSSKGDSWCSQNLCDPSSGECAMTAANEGAPCIDDAPCTQDSSCVAGACKASGPSICACNVDADCADQDDDNACNGVAYCDVANFPWQCKTQSPVACNANDDTACSKNTCEPKTGTCAMVATEDGGDCDDGDNCTVGDVCKAGKCTAGSANTCFCTSQADCKLQEDDTVCNGVLYCDLPKGESKGECKLNQASIVSCAKVDDTPCIKNTCDPVTGLCAMKSLAPASPCDDGDECTGGEICVGGVCGKGVNLCPCKADADCLAQDDGDLCNGTQFCNKITAECEFNPASVVSCKTVGDTACAKQVCEPKTGKCVATPVEKTKIEACDAAGQNCKACASAAGPGCQYKPLLPGEDPPKAAYECDVGDPCTADFCGGGDCVKGTFTCACTDDASCVAQDDGDLCNGTMFCNKAKSPAICEVNLATVISCPSVDNTECVKNTCEPKLGKCFMLPASSGSKCDDGQPCTKNDVCIAGKCQPGAMTCECITNADCLAKDDGNLCNGIPYCKKDKDKPPVCAPNPASVVYCLKTNDTACIKNTCDPVTGNCNPKPGAEGKPCEDGSACTLDTSCSNGECLGKTISCDDGNQCTADTCLALKGCQHGQKNCDDGNKCTLDSCEKGGGKCLHAAAAAGAACDADDNGCTINDHCADGACKAGVAAVCDAKAAPCKLQLCQSVSKTSFQCIDADAADGALCDDGLICSLGGACTKGKCQPGQGARYYLSKIETTKDGQSRNFTVRKVAATATGYVLAGLAYTGNDPDQPQSAWLWARAVDRAGTKTQWEKLLPVDGGQPGNGFNEVQVLANGEVLLAGGRNVGNGLDVVMGRYDATGKALWPNPSERSWDGGSGSNDAARAVVAFPGGGYALAGYIWGAGGDERKAAVRRISGSGITLWAKSTGDQLLNEISDATLSPDAALITAGWSDAGDSTGSGWLSRWDAAGNPEWSQKHVVTGGGRFHALQALPGGDLVAAGWRKTNSGKDSWWLMRTSAKGVKIWERNGQANVKAFGLQRTVSGGFTLTGWSDATGQSHDIWLAGTDSQGNKQWDRAVEVGGIEAFNALVMETDGTLVAVGQSVAQGNDGGASAGLLVRADPWGHSNCAISGECAKLKADACDDEQPCTADVCEAASGCVHKPASDLICDLGTCTDKAVCELGKCTPKGKSKLWARTYAHSSDSEASLQAVHVADNGITWAAMRRHKGSGDAILLYSMDSDGKSTVSTSYGGSYSWSVAWPRDIVSMPGGDVLFVMSVAEKDFLQRARVFRTKINGAAHQALWSKDYAQGTNWSDPKRGPMTPASLLQYPDGTWGLVGSVQWLNGNMSVDLVRFQADGVQLAHTAVETDPSLSETANAGLILKDGSIITAGASFSGPGDHDGLLMKLLPDGKEVWRKTTGGPLQERWSDLQHHPAGGVVTAGIRTQDASTARPWLARFSGDGALLWQRTLNTAGKRSIAGLHVGAQGRVTLAGTTAGALVDQAWLLGADPVGQPVWERALAIGNSTWLGANGLDVHPDGGFAIGGGTLEGGVKKLLLLRADPWGHLSCEQAGSCSTPQLKGCDDGDPCTNDRCDGAKGCLYTVLQCDDGNPCTTNTCDAKLGCLAAPKPGDCDDGSACTEKKGSCAEGACTAKAVDCDDGKACTADTCLPGSGCLHLALDQVPCPVSDGCSKSATCAKGVCQPSAVGLLHDASYNLSNSNAKWSTMAFAAGHPDGSLSGLIARDGAKHVRMLTVDRWGTQTGNLDLYEAYNGTYVYPRGLWRAADGTFWAALYVRTIQYGIWYTWLRHFDVKGALLHNKGYWYAQSTTDQKGAYNDPVDLLFNPDATRTIVNQMNWIAGHTGARLVRTLGDGTAKWIHDLDNGPQTNEAPAAARVFADGSTAVAGRQWVKDQPGRGLLYKVDNGGKLLWRQSYDAGADGRLRFLDVASEGGYVLGGLRDGGAGDRRYWIVRTDAAGALRWQRSPKLAVAMDPVGFAMGPADALTLASTVPHGIVQAIQVVHLDAVGQPLWQRTLQTGSGSWLGGHGLVRTASGDFAVAGGADAFGAPNPAVFRVGPWGHESCSLAGKCAGKKADGCDDGDACSHDICDPKTGCNHDKADCADGNPCTTPSCDAQKGCNWQPKSAACDDGSKCTLGDTCTSGVCQADKLLECGDGNPCTFDACDPKAGCQYQALDAVACPSPGGCSSAGQCQQGQCQPAGAGKVFVEVAKMSSQSTTYDAFHAVLPVTGGGYLALYGTLDKYAYLRQLNATGEYVTYMSLSPSLSSSGYWIPGAMRRLADGDLLLAARYRYSYSEPFHPDIQRRDTTGKQLKVGAKFKVADGHGDPHDLVEYADASLGVIGGIAWTSGYAAGDVIRLQGNGKLMWRKQSHSDPSKNEFGRAGLTFKDGATVVAGYAWKTGAPYDGLIYKLDNSGNQLWKKTWDGGASELIYRLVNANEGGYVASGARSDDGKTWQPWLVRADADGKLLWHKSPKVKGDSRAIGLDVDAAGRITLVGSRPEGIVKRMWMMRLSPLGTALWTRDIVAGASTWAGHNPLTALPGGGFALAGGANVHGAPDPMLVVTDHWGNHDCKAAGLCVGKAPKDCDDGESCTVGDCEALKGCTKATLPDGAVCGDGKTCGSGKCG